MVLGDNDRYKRTLSAIVASKLAGRLQMRGVSSCWHCNIDIYPFQLECVYKAIGMDNVRLMYCDEPGLGKTIEAGLTIKELYETGKIDNALIVCPSNLKNQWKSELGHKIKMEAEIIDNHWEHEEKYELSGVYIVGLEYLRANPDMFDEISWDMIIFDEAHHLAWRDEKQGKTKSYLIARELCDKTKHVLLLTATPIQLSYFDFWSLLNLLRPDRFPDFNTFMVYKDIYLPFIQKMKNDFEDGKDISEDLDFVEDNICLRMNFKKVPNESIDQRLSSLFLLENIIIRHRKRDEIRNIVKRRAYTVPVKYTSDEIELYQDISEYIQSLKRLSIEKKNKGFGLLSILLKQLLTSSPRALLSTIRNRMSNIMEMVDYVEEGEFIDTQLIEEELNKMADYAEKIEKLDSDSKREKLVKIVSKILIEDPTVKIIIFTRFLETQKYLRNILSKQFGVVMFNGKMKESEKNLMIDYFKEKPEIQLLISTESGGEGRNLQFANIVINYDLPWNPVRLEQRIGRVDRLGQIREVSIINMATWDTVEQKIFDKLCERLGLWVDSIGPLDTMVGDISADIAKLIIDKSSDVNLLEKLLDERIEMAKKASISFKGLKVFQNDALLRQNIVRDKNLEISSEEYITFLRLSEGIYDNLKIIKENEHSIILETENLKGEKKDIEIFLDDINPEEGLISYLLKKMIPKSKMSSMFIDGTGKKEVIVSVFDESSGTCILAKYNGENWFTINDLIEINNAKDVEISDKDVNNLNRLGEQACVFINKMTDFQKGPFRPEIVIARNWG